MLTFCFIIVDIFFTIISLRSLTEYFTILNTQQQNQKQKQKQRVVINDLSNAYFRLSFYFSFYILIISQVVAFLSLNIINRRELSTEGATISQYININNSQNLWLIYCLRYLGFFTQIISRLTV